MKQALILFLALFICTRAFPKPGYRKISPGMNKESIIKILEKINHSGLTEKNYQNKKTKIIFTDNEQNCKVIIIFDKNTICSSVDIVFKNIPEKLNFKTKLDFFRYLKRVLSKKYGEYLPVYSNSIFSYTWLNNPKTLITLSAFLANKRIYITYSNITKSKKISTHKTQIHKPGWFKQEGNKDFEKHF